MPNIVKEDNSVEKPDKLQPLNTLEVQESTNLISLIRKMNVSQETIEDLGHYLKLVDHQQIVKMDLQYLRTLKRRLS